MPDLAGHHQAVELAKRCEAMREAVARAVEALESPSTAAAYR